MLYLVLGGERSGKSRFGQRLALSFSSTPLYIATARRWDADFEARIDRHIADRGANWESCEVEREIGSVELSGRVAVLDCVTLWLANLHEEGRVPVESVLESAKKELAKLAAQDGTTIVISNELGLGVHAATSGARKFVELQGWINQHLGALADGAVMMIAGLPLFLKGTTEFQERVAALANARST